MTTTPAKASPKTRDFSRNVLSQCDTFSVVAALMVLVGCQSKSAAPELTTTDPSGSMGMASTAPASAPRSPSAPGRVEVTSAGFQPPRIDVDGTRTLVFRRTTEQTCATAVVFPSLGIQKPLPLNTDVVIELPAETKGELAFQCGMGMDRGKVVVR